MKITSKTFNKLVEIQNASGKDAWRYKDVTEKQTEILLSKGYTKEKILRLNRGSASSLITFTLNEELQSQPYRSMATRGLEE